MASSPVGAGEDSVCFCEDPIEREASPGRDLAFSAHQLAENQALSLSPLLEFGAAQNRLGLSTLGDEGRLLRVPNLANDAGGIVSEQSDRYGLCSLGHARLLDWNLKRLSSTGSPIKAQAAGSKSRAQSAVGRGVRGGHPASRAKSGAQ